MNEGREGPGELPALTTLRGLAALAVLFYHSSSLAFTYAGGTSRDFALLEIWRRGYLAVDLFFFLSGFVLTHVYGSRLVAERNWRAIGGFLWARFCRIYPASFFAAVIFALQFSLGGWLFPTGVSFDTQLIASLTLMQVPWLDAILFNPPSWSISAEFYSYLAFPFLVPPILRLKPRVAITLGAVLVIAIAVGHQGFDDSQRTVGWAALIRAVPEFTVGILAYRYYRYRLFMAFWKNDAVLVCVMAAVTVACLSGVPDGPVLVLLLALLLASVCNSGRLYSLMNAAPLRWLGEVSYSVYIFQAVPFMLMVGVSNLLVRYGLGGAWFALTAPFFALASGALVHRCVDLPARTWLRGFPDRLAAMSIVCRVATLRSVVPASAAMGEREQ